MYQIVFILLVLYSLLEVFNNKRHPKVFYLLYALMTGIATFRYGQHADYFSYLMYYDNPILSLRDPGFMAIILFFRWLGVSKIVFSAIMSLLTMLFAYPFFKNTCKKSIIALLIFWSYCYITCSMCAIRQGLVLGLVLSSYAYYPKIKKRKEWILYSVIVLLMATIHMSVLVVLLFPIISRLNMGKYRLLTPFAIFLGSMLIIIGSTFFVSFLPSFAQERVYSADDESKILQLILRLSILFCVLLIASSRKEDISIEAAKRIILFGFVLYGLLAFSATSAGRLEYYSRMFICLIVGVASAGRFRTNKIVTGLLLLVIIHSALWVRNIDVEIKRAHYKHNITVLNIPYITIFDQSEFDKNAQGISDHEKIMNNIDW